MNYWTIFLTGLTAGGFSCLAVQGGLLAATLAATAEKRDRTSDWLPALMFIIGKLFAYTILGGLLGFFGSIFQITDTFRIIFQVLASVMMLGLALNMLNLHPIFRYFVIQPPKWTGRLLNDQSKSKTLFAPALLGVMTILIPCGVTQAMEVLAITSGSTFSGALVMFMFVLGTSPIFMALGFVTTRLSENLRAKFFKFAAILIIFIALNSVNAAMVLANSPYHWDNFVWAFKETFLTSDKPQVTSNRVEITATSYGYSPREFTVKNNQPVSVVINSKNNRSCARAFMIPSLGISKLLPENGSERVTFTPTSPGRLAFSCSMGMYTGVINVVD